MQTDCCYGGIIRMRKKSHISLARYLVENLNDEELKKHKFSFYLGSILPDMKPSFIYKRHEIDGTYPAVRKHIFRLSEGKKLVEKKKKGRKYYMDLGQISHYLADYFTFPHNKIYTGTLKEHCSYEEQLKHELKRFLRSDDVTKLHLKDTELKSAEILCDFIQQMHEDYIAAKHNIEHDIWHIVEMNKRVIEGMLQLLSQKRIAQY